MSQSSNSTTKTVQWTVSVPADLDADVRAFMETFRFGEEMDFSTLLDKALTNYMMLRISEKFSFDPDAAGLPKSEV